jgi:signal transduction histidine kinase/CheY-like chemotaxis protein
MPESANVALAGPALLRRLEGLVHLVREIGRAHDAKEIYEPALSGLDVVVGIPRSAILLLDPEGVARFVAWRGVSDAYRAAVEGHFPWQLDDPMPRPILVEDVEKDASLRAYRAVFRAERIRALGFIPLIYNERLVGKFMLYFDQPHAFDETEIELTNAVAYLVAFSLERTRLYADLKERDRRKDAFLATLAHELRNPLASASTALALLDERPDDLATLRRTKGVLHRGIAQIAKLVDDLLDVSRITRGMIAVERAPVDLISVVQHAVAPVGTLIASKRQHLALALEPLWIEADALRMEQVITNLVHNAAKYTPPDGHIDVSTRGTDGGVEIRVRDDGIGIRSDMIHNLFDLFVQADASLAKTQGGLGIGLTIVRELVRLQGGSVAATSEGVGRGSEFIVRLPRRIEAPPSVKPATARHPRIAPKRILIVDDNEDAAGTLGSLLEAWGHEVYLTLDGEHAIEEIGAHHPEVVLLDLGLPGMSGYDVARRVRADDGRGVRIIAVSGYGRPEDVALARAAGCDAHLTKPVDLDALEDLIAGDRR